MNKQVQLTKEDWAIRIAGATAHDLVIICFELIIENAGIADALMQAADYKLAKRYSQKARAFLLELMESLDLKYQVGRDLMSVYLYINSLFIRAEIKGSNEPLLEAANLLVELCGAFEVANADCKTRSPAPDLPAMRNSQQVYAGLTYGKSSLNESVINVDKRGWHS